MANDVNPSHGMLDRFKQRINYLVAVENIRDEEKVIVNWPEVLAEIELSDGTVWKSHDNSTGMRARGYGKVSDYFESEGKTVKIAVYVLADTHNLDVIGEAIEMTSFTSMMDIAYEYSKQGPGDFYLYVAHDQAEAGHESVRCVYRNVIIDASTSDEGTDVGPIVESLVNIMSESVIDANKVPKMEYHSLYSAQEITTGEIFWVDIVLPTSNNHDVYEAQLQDAPLPDGLEYVSNDYSKYYLRAKKPGVYQFQMWIMDKHTLYVDKVNYKVEVKG